MNQTRARISHLIAFTLSLAAILVCAHLIRLHQAEGDVDCLGQVKEVAADGLFDCKMAAAVDPLAASGGSLAVVGFVYWCAFTLVLLMRLQWLQSRALHRVLVGVSALAAVVASGLVIWQYSQTERLCAFCLVDALIALLVAGIIPFSKRMCDDIRILWPSYAAAIFVFLMVGAGAALIGASPVKSEEALSEQDFYKLLSQQIAPQYLDQMAPCGFPDGIVALPELEGFFSEQDHLTGSRDASVQVTVLFDPSCPACKHLSGELEKLEISFADAGLAERMTIRYIPLMLYERTLPATQALWILRGTPAFATLKKRLAADDAPLVTSISELRPLLDGLDIDSENLLKRVEGGEGRQEIIDLTLKTYDAGIDSLPRLFINGKPLPQSRRNRSADCIAQTLLGELGVIEADPDETPSPPPPTQPAPAK